mmetsp:Transcript_9647/g.16200  ORF Transcript_9647/g.16200 Transcript_9647/m.16200 type:complete len:91 (+) Transcript_9647:385-657(+)|eukprot:CAMPEP_0168620130 /NCGR_PEP_ID=MMETSP0449_2-20121227/6968_1 /TAXON_ID=1082188 /ORGANISM="Strombidium rassoulzadegani, Strain ras09" /LENGTH=90 /DNA_ID=CAMNT_0008661105 /DNA_START=331 /DNA_END=603 /DNA_ORIENTATION=-
MVIITLVGNKCDLPNREVKYDEAMEFAQKMNLNYIEVSAKTGKNVKSAFHQIVLEVFRKLTSNDDDAMDFNARREDGSRSVLRRKSTKVV